MKELKLNFKILLLGNRYWIELPSGGRDATVTEVLLWNILWELKTGVAVNNN